jgi:hypothetical protein
VIQETCVGYKFGTNRARAQVDYTDTYPERATDVHLMVHTKGEPMNDNLSTKELEDMSLILGATLKKYEKLQLSVAELWILDDMKRLKQRIDEHLKIVKP